MQVTCKVCGITIRSDSKKEPVSCNCPPPTRLTVAGSMVAFGPRSEPENIIPTESI